MTVYGGIVFRVVTPGDVRDESLDADAVMPDFRTEYLCADSTPPKWTLNRDEAYRFPKHGDAVARAGTIGNCHATVARDPNAPEHDGEPSEWRAPAESPEVAMRARRECQEAKRAKIKRARPADGRRNRLAALRAAAARGVARENREPLWYQKGDME